jgi:hypothetical protein
MSVIEFNQYPNETDFKVAIKKQSQYYAHMGGILASTILQEYFSTLTSVPRQEIIGSAYVARHVEPIDFNDVPYDPRWSQANSYRQGMIAGYGIMGIVQPIVTSQDIIQTLVNGISASEIGDKVGLLSRPILMDMGLRGLFLVGAEARELVSQWGSQMSSNIEMGLLFQLGIGTVLHVADAVHIQHNMQQHDQYIASNGWSEALQELSQNMNSD